MVFSPTEQSEYDICPPGDIDTSGQRANLPKASGDESRERYMNDGDANDGF